MKYILFVILVFCSPAVVKSQGIKPVENKEIKQLGQYILQAEFSPFRNYFAFSLGNNTLRIFDKNWDLLLEHQGNPESHAGCFAFSPDGEYLAYARYKGETDIAIIRLSDQRVVQVLERHGAQVLDMKFSNDGRYLVSTANNKMFILWKREGEGFEFHQSYEGFGSYLDEACFSSDDTYLVAGDSYGYLKIYERKGEDYVLFQEFQVRKHGVSSVKFHPRLPEFVTGSSYGIRRYKLDNKQFVFSDSVGENAYIKSLMSYSPQGDYLAIPHYTQVKVYNVNEDSIYPEHVIHRHGQYAAGSSFSEDGKFLTTYANDQQIIIWEINDVAPTDKALVSGWLLGDLPLAQRRSLHPAVTRKIIRSIPSDLSVPRDEFEKTAEYNTRMEALSDLSLAMLQEEMEEIYDVKSSGSDISVSVSDILGYNADREIYKIRFLDTEAGVQIPVEAARKLKSAYKDAIVKAKKLAVEGKKSKEYSDFILLLPGSRKEYVVTPVENPFQPADPGKRAASALSTVEREMALSDTVNGNTYALLFATNVYDYFGDLVNPVLDAQTIAGELKENYGVIAEVVTNSSLEETAAKIREFASADYGKKDNLMVFFAGHGVYDEVFREGYVISKDSRADDLGKTTYLSHSNLRTMINNIDCPHIFLVMDVCFGGTFDPHLASTHRGAGMYSDISTMEFVERKLKYTTRLYLTSGGKEYVPDGRPGFHSPFARRFIESLRHYGGDDGVLTTAEILQFVEKTNPQPRFGEFGDNEPGSDFILVLKQDG